MGSSYLQVLNGEFVVQSNRLVRIKFSEKVLVIRRRFMV